MNAPRPFSLGQLLALWLAVGLAITYGSLIPFEYSPQPFAAALERFRAIPWLDIGALNRADWIANVLIYIPFAYLGMAWAAPALGRAGGALLIVLATALLAGGIEFTQLYFAPRTVSLNDLLAEALGTLAGIVIWLAAHGQLQRLVGAARQTGAGALPALLWLYLLLYVLGALFPFDLLISSSELRYKLASDLVGPLLAPAYCDEPLRCLARLLLEVAAAAPLGLLLSLQASQRVGRPVAALTIGLLAGAVLELLQLLLVSGLAQGASVLTRALGVALGAWLAHAVARLAANGRPEPRRILRSARRWSYVLLLPYLWLLLHLVGGGGRGGLTASEAWHRLGEVSFLPFYYHYFTSEAVALASLIAHFSLYAGIGAFVWLWSAPERRPSAGRRVPALGALVAALTATLLEALRLFDPGLRPDPTNILIAATGAFGAALVCQWAWRQWLASTTAAAPSAARTARAGMDRPAVPGAAAFTDLTATAAPEVVRGATSPPPHGTPGAVHRALALGLLGAAAALGFSLPGIGHWVVLGLLAYLALLYRHPAAWLLVLPSVLAVANFTPWTGRLFFDEADAFVLATLAAFLWQGPFTRVYRRADALPVAFLLLGAVYAVSLLLALTPLPPLDANAFAHYYSPYNALRIAKALFWALLLWPALHAARKRGLDVPRHFIYGLLLALLGVSLVVLWERWAFPGLFNFASDHRVTGSFASMHTGGAFLDGFLALTIPLLALLLRERMPWPALAVPLTGLAVYAALVTYSRGTYAALAVAALVLATAWILGRGRILPRRQLLAAAAVLAVVGGLAFAVLQGGYIQSRFATLERDVATRLDHWGEALAMMDDDLPTQLFGMGPGSFPVSYFWRNRVGVVPAGYWLEATDGRLYLRTNLGDSMYLDQRLRLDPYASYRLTVRYRSDDPGLHPTIALCEKALLYSYRCGWYNLQGTDIGGWRQASRSVTPGDPAKPWDLERPRVLSIVLSGQPQRLDLALVSLRDAAGNELIRNGDFSSGMNHWFFATDNHLPWHIKNIIVSQYFETGLLGAALLGCLLLIAVVRVVRRTTQGARDGPILLASLAGVMTVSLVDSLHDDPRLGMLLWLFVIAVADRRLQPDAGKQSAPL